jgi:hypothetical protein
MEETEIRIERKELGEKDCEDLNQKFKMYKRIEIISLFGNKIKKEGIKELFETFKNNKDIKSLDLGGKKTFLKIKTKR